MKKHKLNIILQSVIVLLIVWLVNQLVNRYPLRIDLTEERKYTISNATRELLQALNQEVFYEIYLAGDLPSNFERFQKSIADMLDQFNKESNRLVAYKFTDPAQANNVHARNQFYQSLMEKGLQPTHLNYRNAEGDKMEKLIFPGAMVSKGMQEVPANLLKGNRTADPDGMLNQAIEGLEYELASAIASLSMNGSKRIGYITGHGSPDSLEIAGFKNAVLSSYELFDVLLKDKNELIGYDAVVIAKPSESFSEKEKYLLDQYLMKGGNLLFFIDALSIPSLDSVFGEGTVAIPRELNLADQLFRYGARINQNYILDVNSGQFPVVTGNLGDQPQIQMIPWPFNPVITNFSNHPSVRNLDAILGQFISEVDTVKAKGIKKTPLLTTSQYTKVLGPPIRVAFNDLRDELRPEMFNEGPKTIGYLLEGKFTSLYTNRLIPNGFDKSNFLPEGVEGKVIVVGDGDMIRNEIDPKSGMPMDLGVGPFTKTTYANKNFILNLLDYLVDDSGLMETRSREIKIRPLDRVKVKQERSKWQLINIALPVFIVLLLGIIKWFLRNRKYAS
ncbi:MAG: gliding motility-associated ABC transporter substrate-binding protein GldG [Bacteroidota bacterium]